MKKNIILTAVVLTAIGLVLSCAKETPTPEEKPVNPQEEVVTYPSVIKAGIPEEMTKVALEDLGVGSGMSLAWEPGDAIRVIATAGGSGNEKFTIKDGFTPTSAEFVGTSVTGDEFTVFYPGTYDDVADLNARSYTSQVQIGNANTDHLEWNAIETGLSNYGSVSFSHKQNGALRFNLKLPAAFTKVYKVALKAPSAIFSTTNAGDATTDELVLTLKADGSTPGITLGEDKLLTAYLMVSWNENEIEEGTELKIEVWGDQEDPWVKTKTVGAGGFTIAGGKVTNVQLNNTKWDEPLFWAGDGTSVNPYVIKTAYHLGNVKTVMDANPTTGLYFLLDSDIDLENTVWEQINQVSPHTPYTIYFDGNNHTISNFSIAQNTMGLSSFFGEIAGEVKDLAFSTATIETGGSNGSAGVLCGIANGLTVTNVDATNVDITITNNCGETTGVGGLIGYAVNSTISGCNLTGCDIDLNSTDTQNVGGLIGRLRADASSVTNCSVADATIAARYCAGGLIGKVGCTTGPVNIKGNTTSGMTVSFRDAQSDSKQGAGGLIGLVEAGADVNVYIGDEGNDNTNTVTNVSISNSQPLVGGLVGKIMAGIVTLTNNTVTGTSTISSTGDYVGGLVGHMINATVSSCTINGASVSGAANVGGLVGWLNTTKSTLSSSKVKGTTVTGTGNGIGGVVGYISVKNVNITDCDFLKVGDVASVSGNAAVGGIVGRSVTTTVKDCDAEGTISASGDYSDKEPYSLVGGIVGRSDKSTVQNCTFNNGSVTGANRTGGIAGANLSGSGSYSGCTVGSNVTITGGTLTGGILGRNHNESTTISNCEVNASFSVSGQQTGGIVGECASTWSITGCTVNMSFTASKKDDRINLGGIIGNQAGGTVTITSCTSTINATHTDVIADASIGFGGIAGCIAGATANLTYCKSAGTVTLGKINTSNKAYAYAGGLIGLACNGKVEKSSSSMTIIGNGKTQRTGGLIGSVYSGNFTVDQCVFSGTLTTPGTQSGGLIGEVDDGRTATVTNSCFSGIINVTAGGYCGAICGYPRGSINLSNSYASGSVKMGTSGSNGNGGLIGGFADTTTSSISGNLNWLSSFDCSVITTSGVTIGAIVGMTITGVTLTDNYRKNALNFTTGNGYVLTDDAAGKDGAEVASGVSCQDKAIELGWDSNIWKLDNTDGYPTLKDIVE